MKESILSLLQTVRLIYSVSKFYNTSERTSSLMVKVNLENYECAAGNKRALLLQLPIFSRKK